MNEYNQSNPTDRPFIPESDDEEELCGRVYPMARIPLGTQCSDDPDELRLIPNFGRQDISPFVDFAEDSETKEHLIGVRWKRLINTIPKDLDVIMPRHKRQRRNPPKRRFTKSYVQKR